MSLKVLRQGDKGVLVGSTPLLQYDCPACGNAMVMDKKEDIMWCESSDGYFVHACSQVGILFEIPRVTLSLKRGLDKQ
jgi:hypothetical protein